MLKKQNIIIKLLLVNTGVFVVVIVLQLFFYLFNSLDVYDKIIKYLMLPANIKTLVLHIWTLFTYMFLHQSFWHILGNMLWLYFMGIIALQYLKDIQILTLYILGGLSGAVLYVIGYNIFPVFIQIKNYAFLLGASAAVTAIVVGIAAYRPREVVYLFGVLKLELWGIAIFMVIWDLALLPLSNPGGHLAHIGGAVYGLIFGMQLAKGNEIQTWAERLLAKIFRMKSISKRRMKVIKNNLRSRDDFEYNLSQTEIKNEIDRILDKISKYGYDSLSKKEKMFLKKYGSRI